MSVTAHGEIAKLRGPRSASEITELKGNGARGRKLSAPGAGPLPFLSRHLSYIAGGHFTIKLVLLVNLIFNLTDLATSFVALRAGLTEGNPLVLGISLALGLNILESLALMKILFVGVSATVALIGTRARDRGTRNLMLGFLLTSTLIFLVVSLSNIRLIVA